MKPTTEQLQNLIKWMEEDRCHLPPFSAFGDDNYHIIDTCVFLCKDALKGVYHKVDIDCESEIYDCLSWIDDTTSSDFYDFHLESKEN